jgi:hypothetical protein
MQRLQSVRQGTQLRGIAAYAAAIEKGPRQRELARAFLSRDTRLIARRLFLHGG